MIEVNYPSAAREHFATAVVCEATYGLQAVPCKPAYDYSTGNLPIVHLDDGLGWSPSEFRTLRRRYFAAQLTERDWLRISTGLIASLAGAIALVIWSARSWTLKDMVAVTLGFTSFGITLATLLWGSLQMLSAPPVWLESLTERGQGWPVVVFLAVLAAAGVSGWAVALTVRGIANWLPERRRGNRLSRLLLCVVSGLNVTLVASRWLLPSVTARGLTTASFFGVAVAIAIWWRPYGLGRVVLGLYGGTVTLIILYYLNLWLLLGLGLMD